MALKKEFLMVSPSVITKTNTVTGNVGHEVLLSLKGSLDLHLSLREGTLEGRGKALSQLSHWVGGGRQGLTQAWGSAAGRDCRWVCGALGSPCARQHLTDTACENTGNKERRTAAVTQSDLCQPTLSLQQISTSEDGRSLELRLLVVPNLLSCAPKMCISGTP